MDTVGRNKDEQQRWTWCWDARAGNVNSYVEFECVAGGLVAGELAVSATTSYRLLGGGTVLQWGPPREVPPYAYVDRVDLSTLPVGADGTRKLSILAHHLGVNTHTHVDGPGALLVGGTAQTAQGEIDLSDPRHWRSRPCAAYQAETHRLGDCIGFSEHHRFGTPNAVWAIPSVVARHPWAHLPELIERDLPTFGFREQPVHSIKPYAGGWLADFSQEVFGFVELEFETDRPVDFEMQYAEVLDMGRVDPQRHAAMNARDRLVAPAGHHRWRSYEKRALRFIQLTAPVHIHRLAIIESQWPLTPVYRDAAYEARNGTEEGRLLNRILDVSARTIELNIEDILTDCPWRERAQYFDSYFWEDALIELFGTDAPIRRFLRQYARGADPRTGRLRMCYPSPPSYAPIVDFSLSYPLHIEKYGQRTGDWALVRELLPLAEASVFGWNEFDQDNLLVDPKGWIFLDNTNELPRHPRSAALNAIYSGAYRALASIYERLGFGERVPDARRKADAIRSAFRSVFLVEGRLLDADSSLALEQRKYWNYNFPADRREWDWQAQGSSFVFRVSVRTPQDALLNFMPTAGLRVWLDGELAINRPDGPGWGRPVLSEENPLKLPGGPWHSLTVQAEYFWADWEFWMSSDIVLEISPGIAWKQPWGETAPTEPAMASNAAAAALRPWAYARHNQITAGYAAYHGMLEPDEARRELMACLPNEYATPWRKRITPFFSTITEDRDRIEGRTLPCHVPSSLFHFARALVKYGLDREAREFILMVYKGMLDRGATTWWEEWESRSSNCHAWACTGLPFLTSSCLKHPDVRR